MRPLRSTHQMIQILQSDDCLDVSETVMTDNRGKKANCGARPHGSRCPADVRSRDFATVFAWST